MTLGAARAATIRAAGTADLIPASVVTSARLGTALAAGDLDDDGNDDLILGAPTTAGGAGAVWILLGPDSGVVPTDSGSFIAQIEGVAGNDLTGQSLYSGSDLNGDGVDDLVIGAPEAGTANEGTASLFYGPVTGVLSITAADVTISGSYASGDFGRAFAAADNDGDGLDDLFVGAPGASSSTGTVYGFLTSGTLPSSLTDSSADIEWMGSGLDEELGYALAVGVVDSSNPVAYLIIGGPENEDDHEDGGIVYGVPVAGAGGDVDAATDGFFLAASSYSTRWGQVLASGFDLDYPGAATDELVVGNDNGSLFVFYDVAGDTDYTDAEVEIVGPGNTELAAAGMPDVNGDDRDELIIGDTSANSDSGATGEGAAYLIYGTLLSGGGVITDFADITFTGSSNGDELGAALATGDFNADGRPDLVAGAPEDEVSVGGAPAVAHAGTGRLFYGPFERLSGSADLADSDTILYGDDAGDLSGYSVAGIGDVNCDGVDDIAIGAVLADEAAVTTGALYVLFGPTPESSPLEWLNTAIDLGTADLVFYESAAGDFAGNTVAGLGDVNGDGCGDFLVAASGDDSSATNAGAAYLFYGDAALGGIYAPGDADATILGAAANDAVATGVGAAGDLDDDGYDDVLIGEPNHDGFGPDTGRALVFFGGEGANLLTGTIASGDADCRYGGEAAGDRAGWKVRGDFDFNADGNVDIAISSPGNDDGGPDAGAVHVVEGTGTRCSGPLPLTAATLEIRGAQAGAQLGSGLATASDVDGDGYDDLLIGAPYHDADTGRAFWVPGGTASGTHAIPMGGTRLCATTANPGRLGWSVATPDLDGDGADDLLIGAPWTAGPGDARQGMALVFYADTVSAWKGDTGCHYPSAADLTLSGEAAQDFAGWSVSDAGDLNQDGEDDLLVGAYGNDSYGTSAGAAYVVLASHLVP